MKVEAVVGSLYRVDLGMVNAYLIDEEEITLIDSGMPGKADSIMSAVEQIGRPPEELKHIVLTHLHADHIGSAAELKRRSGATVYMHPADAEAAGSGRSARQMNPAPSLLSFLVTKLLMGRMSFDVDPVATDRTVEEGERLDFAGGAEVLHLPGHAAGQIGLLLPNHGGVLIAADAATHMGPRIGWPIVVEELETTKATLRRIATMEFEVALFGHGRPILSGAAEEFRRRFGAL
mgnify:CR=1 FL=1